MPRLSLSSLPLELFTKILDNLDLLDMNFLMRTSHTINSITRRTFYKKIYINADYAEKGRTPAIVDLLYRKPGILPLIQHLVLDELEEESYRRLLSFDMPNLRSIEIWHKGPIWDPINAEKKRILNTRMLTKPNLENFSFRINLDAYSTTMMMASDMFRQLFLITPEEAPLLYHPSLNRLRISYADLTPLGSPLVEPFPSENLKTILIETCHYSREALKQLLLRAKSLENFIIRHTVERLPFDPCEFALLLQAFYDRLKILELGCTFGSTTGDMDIAGFTALKYLMISKRALFRSHNSESDFSNLIKERVPPNLKILHLHGLSSDIPTWSQEDPSAENPTPRLARADRLLLETLVSSPGLLPHLRYLIWTNARKVARSQDLEVLAAQNGIIMVGVTERYCTDPDRDWLDETLPLERSIEEACKSVAKYWQNK